MNKAIFISFLLAGIIAVSGCITDGLFSWGNPAYGDGVNRDTGGPVSGSDSEDCGYLNGPCCEYFGRDEFGSFTARYYCNEGTCIDAYCEEGPDYGTYDRNLGP